MASSTVVHNAFVHHREPSLKVDLRQPSSACDEPAAGEEPSLKVADDLPSSSLKVARTLSTASPSTAASRYSSRPIPRPRSFSTTPRSTSMGFTPAPGFATAAVLHLQSRYLSAVGSVGLRRRRQELRWATHVDLLEEFGGGVGCWGWT
ncbi:transducin family protein / WD-40 repeat family protein [Striga asiatica]|uniref:Transducin family protein / WD-40 repeat family protein n=1 Tax=Striga asiatica TaxID=4170 RepID=A0A5A7QCN4_STRAF|nr:transducin family protein / WD-40 repeat family protein [Striga asiatica]